MQNFIWHSSQLLGSLFSPPLAKWMSRFALLWKLWLHLSHWYGLFDFFLAVSGNFSSILGISREYHGRFMVQWNTRKSFCKCFSYLSQFILKPSCAILTSFPKKTSLNILGLHSRMKKVLKISETFLNILGLLCKIAKYFLKVAEKPL